MSKKIEIVPAILAPKDLFNHCAAWRRAANMIKQKEAEKAIHAPLILGHSAATGMKNFMWDTTTVTVVAGSPSKMEVDAKMFVQNARRYMSPEDFAKCEAESVRETGGKNPYLR